MKRSGFALVLLLLATTATASPAEDGSGQVQLPLDIYTQLIQQAQRPDDPKAPINFALGNAQVQVSVDASGPRVSAEIQVSLSIQIFENRWALVPILPPGTPVTEARIQGNPVGLVTSPQGLAWITNQKGAYTMTLR